MNDTRPSRAIQFFETQLAGGVDCRDHLNGTHRVSCPAEGCECQT